MLGHEVLKVFWRVLALSVFVQQVVQVVEHLVDPLPVLVGGVLQGLLHAGEALVEHFAAEQILDLLVLLAGLRGAPVVFGELLHRLGRGRRQRFQLQLAEPGVVVERARQLLALGQHRVIEKLLDLGQRAVEVVALQQLPSAPVRLGGQPVGAGHVLRTAAQQFRQRPPRRGALHDVLPDRFQRFAQVDGRGQRVGPAGVSRVPRCPRLFRPHCRTPQRSSYLAA